MILLLNEQLADHPLDGILGRIRVLAGEFGMEAEVLEGAAPNRVVRIQSKERSGSLPHQDRQKLRRDLEALSEVEAVLGPDQPYWRVARRGRELLQIRCGAARFGAGRAAVIAGPCAVEDQDRLLRLARQVQGVGATVLRGGAYKPRTSPYSFQGLGTPGLEILAAVGQETGLAVCTEVLDPRDLPAVAEVADILQIGSRNMMNYALLRAVAEVGKPVLLKRGMSATRSEFLLAAEYVAAGGSEDILLCERGLRHFDPAVRNLLDLSLVPALREETHLPVVVDPSHGTGLAKLVPPLLAAAAAVGADGFMVEVHDQPRASQSDPEQALTPVQFAAAMQSVRGILDLQGRRLALPATPEAAAETEDATGLAC